MQSLSNRFKSRPPLTNEHRYLPNDLSRLYGNHKLDPSMVNKNRIFKSGVVHVRNDLPRVRLDVMKSEKLFGLILEELGMTNIPWLYLPNGQIFGLMLYDKEINAEHASQVKSYVSEFLDSPEYKIFPILLNYPGHASAAVIRKINGHPMLKGYLEVYEPGFSLFFEESTENAPLLDHDLMMQAHNVHRALGLGPDFMPVPAYMTCPMAQGPQARVKRENVRRYGTGLCRSFSLMALLLRIANPDKPPNEVAAYITQRNNGHVMELVEKFAYAFAKIWAKYKQTDKHKQNRTNPFHSFFQSTFLWNEAERERYLRFQPNPGNKIPKHILPFKRWPKSLKYGYGSGLDLHKLPLTNANAYNFSKLFANGEFTMPKKKIWSNPFVSNNSVMKGTLARLRNNPVFDKVKSYDIDKFYTDFNAAKERLASTRFPCLSDKMRT